MIYRKSFTVLIFSSVFVLSAFAVRYTYAAWTGPSATPPSSNTPPPITGSGSTAYIPRLTGAYTIGNSSIASDGLSSTAIGKFFLNTLQFVGNGQNSNNAPNYYGIYQEAGPWTSPFPDLRIQFYTGIKYDAYAGYGGHQFFTGYDGSGNPVGLKMQIADDVGISTNLNVTGSTKLNGGYSSNWAPLNIGGLPYGINSQGAIYSYAAVCAGMPSGDCTGVGGTRINSAGVTFQDGSTQTTASTGGLGGSGSTNYMPRFTGASTLGNSSITSDGVSATANGNFYTTGNIGVTGAIVDSGSGNTIRDAGGGWDRTYGNTGWYNGTYGGGLYMQDTTWVRVYNNKGLWTGSGPLGGDGGLTIGYGGVGSPAGGAIIAGNVGIGTASPGAKLEVNGNTIISGVGIINGGSSSNWAALNIGGGNSINANGAIYSYDSVCAGMNSGNCTGGGGTKIIKTGITFPDGSTQSTAATGGVGGSGTAGYIPRLTGATTLGNSSITSDGVSATANGNFYTTGNIGVTGAIVDSGSGNTIRDAGGGWDRTYGNTGWYNGTYGGGLYMQDTTWVRVYNNKGLWTGSGPLGGDGGLTIGYGGVGSPAGGAIIAGNVGIGTASPGAKLEVNGAVLATSYSALNGSINTVLTPSSLTLTSFGTSNTITAQNLNLQGSSGRTVVIDPDSGVVVNTTTTGGNSAVVGINTSGSSGGSGGNGVKGESNSIGGYGVYGKSTNSTGYGVYGSASGASGWGVWCQAQLCGGTVGWSNASDARLKKNVVTISNALDRLMNLRGVNFEWIDGRRAGPQVGFIAQEVEKVLPEVVNKPVDPKSYYSLDYGAVTSLEVEAIKDLKNQVDTLKAENKSLEARLSAIEAKLK